MALPIRSALRSAGRYVARNPFSIVRMARHAANLRVAVPLDAIRWVVMNTPPGKNTPTDVTVAARPPAVNLGATVELMGTKLRASSSIYVDDLRVGGEEIRVTLRLADVDMKVLGDGNSPIGGLLKSGALDLSKPGNLVNFMPKKPPVLIEAKDDILVVDLMKVPKLARNDRLRRVLGALTPVMNVAALRTEGDYLILALRATPAGFPRALSAARA
jgi:hypothetical protein